jgi:hypothetical protein
MAATMYITSIVVSHTDESPGPEYTLLPTRVANSYIWSQASTENPLTGISVLYDDAPVPDGALVTANLQEGVENGRVIRLALSHGGDAGSAIRCFDFLTAGQVEELSWEIENRSSKPVNPDAADMNKFLVFGTQKQHVKVVHNIWEIGDVCDALDGTTWRTVDIIGKRSQGNLVEVQIHFQGWGANYDEWRAAGVNPKLAAQCAMTKGRWTGREAKPVRLSEQLEKVEIQSEALQNLLRCTSLTTEQQTAFTGENLQFLHKLLLAQVDQPDLADTVLNPFIQLNIQVALQFLKQDFIGVADVLRVVIEPNAFYKACGNGIDAEAVDGKFVTRTTQSFYLASNVEYFGQQGGFSLIANRLTQFADPEDTKEKSFVMVSALIRVLSGVRLMLKADFVNAYMASVDLQHIVLTGLTRITDQELKTFKEAAMNKMITDVKTLLKLTKTDEEIAEFIETINLDTALRLMTSDVLEKKLNGMTKFDEIIKSVTMTEAEELAQYKRPEPAATRIFSNGVMYISNRPVKETPKISRAKFLTADGIIKWVTDRKVVNTVLNRLQHEQVVKRSSGLLRFLAQQGALEDQHIDLLWAIATGRHEDLVRIVYRVFAELAQDLNETQLGYLFESIQRKPLNEYKEFDLSYVAEFTDNAVKKMDGKQWYGMDIFWGLLQDDSGIPPDLCDLTLEKLSALLKKPHFAPQRSVFRQRCLEGIRSGAAIYACVQLIFLMMQALNQSNAPSPDMSAFILELEQEDNFLSLIIAALETYMARAREAAAKLPEGTPLRTQALSGRYSHEKVLDKIGIILRVALTRSPAKLSYELVDQFFTALVRGAVGPEDAELCFKFLTFLAKSNGVNRGLDEKCVMRVFTDILSQPQTDLSGSPVAHSGQWYTCFEAFFLSVNFSNDAITQQHPTYLLVRDTQALEGVEAIWIFAGSANAQVAESGCELLTTMYVRLGDEVQDKKAIFQRFIDDCVNRIRASTDAKLYQKTEKFVFVLSSFLRRLASGEGSSRPLWEKGEKIRARYISNGAVSKGTYPGKIVEVNGDGTYNILYDDGDKNPVVPEDWIRDPQDQPRTAPPPVEISPEDQQFPMTYIAASPTTFNLFLSYLDLGGNVALATWQLLRLLPENTELTEQIATLSRAEGKVSWGSILSSASVIKLLYSLQSVHAHMIQEDPDEEVKQFSAMFFRTGGLSSLVTTFLGFPIQNFFENELSLQCLGLVLQLILHFLSSAQAGVSQDEVTAAFPYFEIISTLLNILHFSAVQRSESQSAGFTTLFSSSMTLLVDLLPVLLKTEFLADVLALPVWNDIVLQGLIQHPKAAIRTLVREVIQRFCTSQEAKSNQEGVSGLVADMKNLSLDVSSARAFFLPILLGQLNSVDTSSSDSDCTELLLVLSDLLSTANSSQSADIDAASLSATVLSLIKNHPFRESTASVNEADPVLAGLLKLTTGLVTFAPELKTLLGARADSTDTFLHLLADYLFRLPSPTDEGAALVF